MGKIVNFMIRIHKRAIWALALGLSVTGCTSLTKGLADLDVGLKERGIASWYGDDFHGLQTANGETFDMEAMTGAHRTLPLGTIVKVTNVKNGRQVKIKINDRGPYIGGRILDLSYGAARELGMVGQGVAPIQIEVLGADGHSMWMLGQDSIAMDEVLTSGRRQIASGRMVGNRPRPHAMERPASLVRGSQPLAADIRRERRARRDELPDMPDTRIIPWPL
jgi:rare lipoprotein A